VGKKWLKDPNSPRRVLADSSNAKHRFGFSGDRGSPILEAPKLSDLWFIEYKPVTDGSTSDTSRISALAKTVSPISISTATMPIDAYGKRIYVPTRVDFPEVGITMHDTVDGKMFEIAESIYGKFFKNQDAKVTGANAEAVLTSAHEHGRKIPDGKHDYYHQHFEKITIYHFFGNLDGPGLGAPPSSLPRNAGRGTVQKIELINPLVTNITFSGSDYSTTDLRTVDLQVQPENIIIGNVDDKVTFPDWMSHGMGYMLKELSPQYKRKEGNIYPDWFGDTGYGPRTHDPRFKKKSRADGTEEWVDNEGKKRSNVFGDGKSKRKLSNLTEKELQKQKLRIENQEDLDTNRKLSELMTLYNAQIENPNEQGNDALVAALKSRIGVIDAARAKRFYSGNIKNYEDDFNERDSQFKATYTNPDIPTFGGIGDSNPGGTQFPRYSTDLGSSMIQELIGSFLGKRKFDVGNITGAIVNNMIGNDGKSESRKILGSVLTDGMVSSNKGAYVTTVKANKSIPTNKPTVFKTNTTDQAIGVSRAILRKFFNN